MRCWYGWNGGFMSSSFMGGWFMPLIWALIVGGIVWLVVSHLNSTRRATVISNHVRGEQALDILQKRYARGEIDDNTYLDMKDRLSKK